MKGSESHLLEFLEGARKRFIIPVYQRNYEWKKENCKQLFDDLVSVIKEDKESHFFGSIVSCAHGKNEVVLIDGQQRITTISLILIAMINAMKKGVCVPEDSRLCEILENTYIVDRYRKEERKVRLKPFRDDCEAFDRLIYKDDKEFISESKVTINYRYFYDRIVTARELTVDELYRALDSLQVIDIELEPEHGDNPQLIFESLNSTGLDLSESDKIRNYVLMNLAPKVQEDYYDKYWNKIERFCKDELDGFVRNYLTIKLGVIPNLKSIYSSFKDYTKGGEIEPILQDMLRYGYAFNDITSFHVGGNDVNEVAERLDLLDMTVAYPFLMAFLVYAKENEVENAELFKVFSCVEAFIFRRLMCDLPTNALNKIFATLHSSVLKNKRDSDSYSSVLIYLLESKKLSGAFPKDEEFQSGFTTKNIYSMRGKNKAYLFERLENGSSKEKNDVVGNIEKGILTIEHIMPQTLSPAWKQSLGDGWEEIQERWLHTIANLTLSGYNYNYSNKSFQEKKAMENGFIQSGLRLNHYIAQFDSWGEAELQQRKDFLSEIALKIWAYPKTDYVPIQKEDDIVPLSEDNGVATNRDIQFYVFRGERHDVKTWAEMMWEVVNQLFIINPAILYQEAAGANVWFDNKAQNKGYRQIAVGLFYCPSSSSTWNKMAILKNLFRLYQIDEDDLSFGLMPPKEETTVPEGAQESEAKRHANRFAFWSEFIQYCETHNGVFTGISPVTAHWISKSIKVPYGIKMDAVVLYDFARMEIYFASGDKEQNKEVFDFLYARKDTIEKEYGKELIWERISDKIACRIKDDMPCRPFEAQDKTPIFEFMKEASDKMSVIFHKHILEYQKDI